MVAKTSLLAEYIVARRGGAKCGEQEGAAAVY